MIEKISARKIPELNELYQSVDQRKRVMREMAVDLVEVRKQIDNKTKSLNQMTIELDKLQKVNEIHIEIDVL